MSPRKRETATVVEDLELEDFEDEVYEDDEEEAEATPKKGKPRKVAESNGISATQLAERLELEPKTFRAWLRNQEASGKLTLSHEKKARYDFGESWDSPEIVAILTRYEEWKATASERRQGNAEALAKGRAKAAANRAARKAAAEAEEVEEDELEEEFEDEEEEEVETPPPAPKRRRKTSG